MQFQGVGTLSQIKQSIRWLKCIGPEGQVGKLRPYVADIAINLWGRDLLQQWKTQINIPSVSGSGPEIHQTPNKNFKLVRECYQGQLETVQAQLGQEKDREVGKGPDHIPGQLLPPLSRLQGQPLGQCVPDLPRLPILKNQQRKAEDKHNGVGHHIEHIFGLLPQQ